MRELHENEIDAVRQHLQAQSWQWDLDVSGMPWELVDQLKWVFTDVGNALTPPYRIDEALSNLRRARDLVAPGENQ